MPPVPPEILVVGPRGALLRALLEGLTARPEIGVCRGLEPSETADLLPPMLSETTLVAVPRRGDDRDDDTLITTLRHLAPGARRLVVVSSAMVHAPSHRHTGHLAEDRLPRRPPENRIARRWRALEDQATEAVPAPPRTTSGIGTPAPDVVILRPTAVLLADTGDPVGRLIHRRLALVPAGYDPPLQLLPLTDLVAAVVQVIVQSQVQSAARASAGDAAAPPDPRPTIRHIAPLGVVPLRRALDDAGVWRLPMPTFVLRALHRLTGRPVDELEYLRYPWTVSDALRRRDAAQDPVKTALAPRPDTDPAVAHDPFGLDRVYIRRLGRTLFRLLHDVWWRVEWRGLEHVPTHGGAILVGNHRGHQPWDGVMILHHIVERLGRFPRFLLHPTLVKFPHLAPYMIRCGGLHACRENGDWVLAQNELLAIFPEGIRGAFSTYATAHRLKRFRLDYVRLALRHQVPIVPLVVLGSAEIFPILTKIEWRWWKRWSEWPTLPVTPTLSLVPLPSKWHIQVLEPIPVEAEYGPEAADDLAVVRAIDRRVRQRMAKSLASMVERRRSLFHGSIFENTPE